MTDESLFPYPSSPLPLEYKQHPLPSLLHDSKTRRTFRMCE